MKTVLFTIHTQVLPAADVPARINEWFADATAYVLAECTDRAFLQLWKPGSDMAWFARCQSCCVFNGHAEIRFERAGERGHIRCVEETGAAQGLVRESSYLVRKTTANSCGARTLRYREYFVPDEDGMLQCVAGRLCGLDAGGKA